MAKSGIIKGGINYSKLGGGIKKWHNTFRGGIKQGGIKIYQNLRGGIKNVA